MTNSIYPPLVQSTLSKMTEDQKMTFEAEYRRQRKDVAPYILLAIFFPIQLFCLGRLGLGLAFLLSAGGLGFWWFIELFLTSERVKEYNDNIALSIAKDMSIMTQASGF